LAKSPRCAVLNFKLTDRCDKARLDVRDLSQMRETRAFGAFDPFQNSLEHPSARPPALGLPVSSPAKHDS
jgi:hypothetical protein